MTRDLTVDDRSDRNLHAFTLIELLVVLSVISLLVSILLPALAKARQAAQASQCLANVRSLAQGNHLYAADNRVWIGFFSGSDRKKLLFPYLRQGANNQDADFVQVWNCPSNERLVDSQDALDNDTDTTEAWEASYGFNSRLNFRRPEDVLSQAATVMVGDGGINDAGVPKQSTHLMSPGTAKSTGLCAPNPRHRQGEIANIAWVDGHATAQKIEPPFYPAKPDPAAIINPGQSHLWRPVATQTDPFAPGYLDQLWDLK